MGTHTGTHLDVPAHVILGQKTVENFKLTSKKLKKAISNKTKWLILNSPSNPTGVSLSLIHI